MRFAAQLHSGRFLHPLLHRLTARRSLCFLSPPDPFARNGLSLACNGCSPSKPPFQGQPSRSATPLSSVSPLQPVRPSRATAASGFPAAAASPRAARCRFFPADPLRTTSFHSPLGILLPSGSTRPPVPLHAGPPSPLARSPFAPRSLTSIARPPPYF